MVQTPSILHSTSGIQTLLSASEEIILSAGESLPSVGDILPSAEEASTRDSITPINYVGDTMSICKDFTKSKVKVTFQDNSTFMPNIINLYENSLRRSCCLKKDKLEILNSKYAYNLFTNFYNSC